MNKKKDKDKLTHAQFEILRKQHNDARTTDKWIRSTGLSTATFDKLNLKLLQAQFLQLGLTGHIGAPMLY
jgi:hypothetical protein